MGPVIAATVIGDVRDVSRFGGRDRFAAYKGTAPIEVSSGNRVIHRLSRRGNRRLNHAIHMAAVTQVRYPHSDGRAYYDKKIAEGKTGKEALRALKRQISDAIYKHLKADAARAATQPRVREGNRERLCRQRRRSPPNASSSAKPLPDLPHPTITAQEDHLTHQKKGRPNHLTQRGIVRRDRPPCARCGAAVHIRALCVRESGGRGFWD